MGIGPCSGWLKNNKEIFIDGQPLNNAVAIEFIYFNSLTFSYNFTFNPAIGHHYSP